MNVTLFRLVLSGVLIAIASIPLGAIVALAVVLRRRRGVLSATLAACALLVAYAISPFPRIAALASIIAVPATRFPLVTADLLLSRTAREEVVALARAGQLRPGEYEGEYRLPASAAGLSVWGEVDVFDEPCGMKVFFMTLTWFSPDPYGGFEYVPPGCTPDSDPLGSGAGTAYPLGGPWYWIEAS